MTVVVIGICSAAHMIRCLDALLVQRDAPEFDTLVVYDPNITGVPGGDVPCAVETQRRLGSRLRDHLCRLSES